jgi:hypothetical protein
MAWSAGLKGETSTPRTKTYPWGPRTRGSWLILEMRIGLITPVENYFRIAGDSGRNLERPLIPLTSSPAAHAEKIP